MRDKTIAELAEKHDLTPQQVARVCDLIWSGDWSDRARAMRVAAETYIWQRGNAAALGTDRRAAHDLALKLARSRWHYLTGLVPPPPPANYQPGGFDKSVYYGRKYGRGTHG